MSDALDTVSSFLIMIGVFASIRALATADKSRRWTEFGGKPSWQDHLQGVGCLVGIVGLLLVVVSIVRGGA